MVLSEPHLFVVQPSSSLMHTNGAMDRSFVDKAFISFPARVLAYSTTMANVLRGKVHIIALLPAVHMHSLASPFPSSIHSSSCIVRSLGY